MRTFLIGIILGALITAPATVLADRVIETPTTNPIYDVGDTRQGDISVFDDKDNKCYVVMASADNDEADISCVKR